MLTSRSKVAIVTKMDIADNVNQIVFNNIYFTDSADLEVITALALGPGTATSDLAVYGIQNVNLSVGHSIGFIFILYADTGRVNTGLV